MQKFNSVAAAKADLQARITAKAVDVVDLIQTIGMYEVEEIAAANEALIVMMNRLIAGENPGPLSKRDSTLIQIDNALEEIKSYTKTMDADLFCYDERLHSNLLRSKLLVSPAGFHPSQGMLVRKFQA